jgi:hypothetical protein
MSRARSVVALAAAAAFAASATLAFGQEPPPTEPVVTEPAPPAPVPDPAPDPPPPARAQPQPKPKAKPTRPVAQPRSTPRPSVTYTPPRPQTQVVVPARPRTTVRRTDRPAAPKAKATPRKKPKTTPKKRPVRTAPNLGDVAGATTTVPNTSADADAALPSDLAVVPIEPTGDGQTITWTSLVMTGLIALALGLAVLASMPSAQLAFLPASRWIVKRRLDLVIGGMGVLMGAICVLLINAVFGP